MTLYLADYRIGESLQESRYIVAEDIDQASAKLKQWLKENRKFNGHPVDLRKLRILNLAEQPGGLIP